MRLLTPLAAAAALAIAAPAVAQNAPPAPPPARTVSPEEAAIEAKGAAFESVMNQLNTELETILGDETKSAETATAEANAAIDRRAGDISTFARDVEAFIRAEAAKPENAEKKDELLAAATQTQQAIASIPEQIRAGVQQALAARTAAPARPQ